MATLNDLRGQRFGRLVVIGPHVSRKRRTFWTCQCDCGETTEVVASNLHSGVTRSCGCLGREVSGARFRTHGLGKPPEFAVWVNMRNRCEKPDATGYAQYGGRGIAVCERWQSFEHFYADMGTRPSPDHQLDRIENAGNYEPGNCRWVTRRKNRSNSRDNVLITYAGVTATISEWERRIGVSRTVVWQRINHLGWPIEKALTTPPRRSSRSSPHMA